MISSEKINDTSPGLPRGNPLRQRRGRRAPRRPGGSARRHGRPIHHRLKYEQDAELVQRIISAADGLVVEALGLADADEHGSKASSTRTNFRPGAKTSRPHGR